MTDKLTGPAAAAREIMEELPIETLAERCEVASGPNPDAEVKSQSLKDIIWSKRKSSQVEQEIEAIILKLCPEDKAEKLVETLRAVEVKMSHILGVIIDRSDYLRKNYSVGENLDHIEKFVYEIRNNVRAALADYEEK